MDAVDLTGLCNRGADACSRELIHLPNAIQPHGVLIGLDAENLDLAVKSANADAVFGGMAYGALRSWLPPAIATIRRDLKEKTGDGPTFLSDVPGLGRTEAHCFASSGLVYLEFELPAPSFTLASASLAPVEALKELGTARNLVEAADIVARSVSAVSGFERVVVYRFTLDGDGEVIGESLAKDWDQSFLGLRFPASDIPTQARALYRVSPQRWVPVRDYEPVPLVTERSREPVDLGLSLYRSLSPVHRAYQRNIGADGSMSLSILCKGELWGLVIGHHRRSHRVSAASRHATVAIAGAFSLMLGAGFDRLGKNSAKAALRGKLFSKLAFSQDCISGLTGGEPSILDLIPGCTGAAVVWSDETGACQIHRLGEAPPSGDVAALADWIRASAKDPVFACDCISERFAPFLAHREHASGVLALQSDDPSRLMALFFRPEVIRAVSWAGKPEKLTGPNAEPSLPRRSFERWIEAKRNHSEAWLPAERAIAADFLQTVHFVLVQEARRKLLKGAEQSALEASRAKSEFLANNRRLAAQNRALAAAKAATEASNRELEAFSYSVAHDLRAPLRSVDGFCQILEEEYAQGLDETGRDYLGRVRRAAQRMAALIEDLLRLARITQGEMAHVTVNLSELAKEISDELHESSPERRVEFHIAPDILTSGDPRLLRVVLENLLANAWKFTGTKPVASIAFGAEEAGGQTVLYVRDNGVGFEMDYAGRLFRAFQRLHGAHDFPGTGIGLATAQRIVNKHGGRIWAEASPGEGATFRFTLCDPGVCPANES